MIDNIKCYIHSNPVHYADRICLTCNKPICSGCIIDIHQEHISKCIKLDLYYKSIKDKELLNLNNIENIFQSIKEKINLINRWDNISNIIENSNKPYNNESEYLLSNLYEYLLSINEEFNRILNKNK